MCVCLARDEETAVAAASNRSFRAARTTLVGRNSNLWPHKGNTTITTLYYYYYTAATTLCTGGVTVSYIHGRGENFSRLSQSSLSLCVSLLFFLIRYCRGLTDCSRTDPSGSRSIFLVPKYEKGPPLATRYIVVPIFLVHHHYYTFCLYTCV